MQSRGIPCNCVEHWTSRESGGINLDRLKPWILFKPVEFRFKNDFWFFKFNQVATLEKLIKPALNTRVQVTCYRYRYYGAISKAASSNTCRLRMAQRTQVSAVGFDSLMPTSVRRPRPGQGRDPRYFQGRDPPKKYPIATQTRSRPELNDRVEIFWVTTRSKNFILLSSSYISW
jgi:hypothetical protein